MQNRPKTLVEVVKRHAQSRPDAPVFQFDDRVTSFATFDRRTDKVANAMAALGIGPGDRVVYLGKNSDVFFEVMFGAIKLGAYVVPIGWRLAQPEIAYIVEDASPKLIVCGPEGDEIADRLSDRLKALPRRSVDDGSFAAWADGASSGPPAYIPKPSDLIVQLYTSGTTGRPKGAMLTQHSFVKHLDNMVDADVSWNRWSADDVSWLPMPVSHVGGAGWGIWAIYHGARTIIERQFTIEAAFDRIEKDGITKMFIVPAALQQMVRHPRAAGIDYSRIRNMNYGASPISPALLRECTAMFGCSFTQMYGMTETIGTVVALAPEDHVAPGLPKIRSAGKAVPGAEIAVFDLNGHRCAANEIGEVAVRGVAQMAGYWKLPEETARTIDRDGWLHTGDAGYLDEDGYLFIHDRIKDMIVTGGENVYSVEVEAALCEHPDVAEAAVIGIPSETWGEEVAAFVVLRPGRQVTENELVDFTRNLIAGFKVPRLIRVVDELPRNPSGKILKRELREPFWKNQTRQVS